MALCFTIYILFTMKSILAVTQRYTMPEQTLISRVSLWRNNILTRATKHINIHDLTEKHLRSIKPSAIFNPYLRGIVQQNDHFDILASDTYMTLIKAIIMKYI